MLRPLTIDWLVVVYAGRQKNRALVAFWIGWQVDRGGHHTNRVHGDCG